MLLTQSRSHSHDPDKFPTLQLGLLGKIQHIAWVEANADL